MVSRTRGQSRGGAPSGAGGAAVGAGIGVFGATMLVMGIEEAEDGDEMTEEMVTTYLSGDLDGIQEIIDTYLGDEYAEINEDLLIDRNRDWIPKIRKLIAVKPAFIAVGAGHLPGENGIINLLRDEGYTVEAVR